MKTLKILIAEDEGLVAAGLKSQVEALGHQVVGLAKDGMEAVELTERLSPDLVLMDVRMPRLDGIQAAKKLQETLPTPILFITAHSDLQLAADASKAGALGYLIKPVNGPQLQPAIQVAVSRFDEIAALRRSVMDLKEDIEARKHVERAKGILMKRLRLDEGDAFGLLQRRSRNTRKPMAEVASQIIAADTFFAEMEKELHHA
ncbi:MAG TPA: response regulator [Candidatus Sulfotelmatobacter sp.]|nr:response regulator [Candidatus Sulfotelmatobacter sp.]